MKTLFSATIVQDDNGRVFLRRGTGKQIKLSGSKMGTKQVLRALHDLVKTFNALPSGKSGK